VDPFEQATKLADQLFGTDRQFVLATAADLMPSARVVDTLYFDGAFYVVTNRQTHKVAEIAANPKVALCNGFYRLDGVAENIGHPMDPANKEVRRALVEKLTAWYFTHTDETDPDMCILKITPLGGFIHADGTGYIIDFEHKTAQTTPFTAQVEMQPIRG
jgi:general stress protein 26